MADLSLLFTVMTRIQGCGGVGWESSENILVQNSNWLPYLVGVTPVFGATAK